MLCICSRIKYTSCEPLTDYCTHVCIKVLTQAHPQSTHIFYTKEHTHRIEELTPLNTNTNYVALRVFIFTNFEPFGK